MKKLFLLVFILGCTSARANFTTVVDAGQITGPAGVAMTQGSLLLLVAAGTDGIFSPVAAGTGSYVSGDDVLLAASSFNLSGGTNETVSQFNANLNATTGQAIALLWFPTIPYDSSSTNGGAPTYQTATLTATTPYGEYSPRFSNPANLLASSPDSPDGGNPWTVPSGGAIDLDFFTANSDGGGTQLASEGFASDFAIAVPEPSCGGITGVGLLALMCLRTWKRHGSDEAGV